MAGHSAPRVTTQSPTIDRALGLAKVDFVPAAVQPSWARLFIATVVSLVGSLAADAVLVVLGTKVFPSTKGYVHFQFPDYAKLTIIGVIIACAAWPVVTRISSQPRWLFFRLAILVTLVAVPAGRVDPDERCAGQGGRRTARACTWPSPW